MAELVEIHVPLVPSDGLPPDVYQYPWIDRVGDFLFGLQQDGDIEVYDDGEQDGDAYVYFVTGADEATLLAAAARVAALPGVPAGAFAIVTDDTAAELGRGTRLTLPRP